MYKRQPDTAASTISTTVSVDPAAPGEHSDSPITPRNLDDGTDDRRRLTDLEGEVSRYQSLLNDIQQYVAVQQHSHDAALASSQAQVDQLINALATSQAAAVSIGQNTTADASFVQPAAAASSGQTAAASAEANNDAHPAGPQQGDCPSEGDSDGATYAERTAAAAAAEGAAASAEEPCGVTRGSQQGDSSADRMRMARGMSSAADALLLWICFAMHDLPLFCDQGKRWTTNCASLFAFVHITRPELTSAFFEGIQQPGYAAHQAIRLFRASWLRSLPG